GPIEVCPRQHHGGAAGCGSLAGANRAHRRGRRLEVKLIGGRGRRGAAHGRHGQINNPRAGGRRGGLDGRGRQDRERGGRAAAESRSGGQVQPRHGRRRAHVDVLVRRRGGRRTVIGGHGNIDRGGRLGRCHRRQRGRRGNGKRVGRHVSEHDLADARQVTAG